MKHAVKASKIRIGSNVCQPGKEAAAAICNCVRELEPGFEYRFTVWPLPDEHPQGLPADFDLQKWTLVNRR